MVGFVSASLSEIEWQHKIIKSERARGNYAGKWSSSVQVGKPDLILHFPKAGGVLMEVKLFRDVKGDAAMFDRKIDITAKQREELEKFEAAGGTGVIGVVVDYGGGKARLYALPCAAGRLRPDSGTARSASGSWDRGQGFNVERLVRVLQDQTYEYSNHEEA